MKLIQNSTLPLSVLQGALLINANGAEFFVKGIGLSVGADNQLRVQLQIESDDNGECGVYLDSLGDWQCQLRLPEEA